VEGPDTAQDCEAKEDGQEPRILEGSRESRAFHLDHVKGKDASVLVLCPVHDEGADEGNHGTDEQVQGQLHGCVFTSLDPAPNGDQQVHREHSDFIEEEQHEQVE